MRILTTKYVPKGGMYFIVDELEFPVHRDKILGEPRPGSQLKELEEKGTYIVESSNVDPDCVGGACGTGGNA